MANTNNNITQTLVQDEVLPALKLGLLPLDAVSFKATADKPLYYSDTIRVPVVTARTAGVFAGNWQTGNSQTDGTAVVIEKPTFCAAHIDPTEEMPTMGRMLALSRECAYGTAKLVLQDVLALFTEANLGTGAANEIIKTVGNYDTDTLQDARKLLWDKGVDGQVSAIHTTAYMNSLGKDAALKDLSASGSNFILTGEYPSLYGIRNFYTDAIPAAITNQNTGVIVTNPKSVAVAMGVPGDPGGDEAGAGIRTTLAVDPETGISLAFRQWVDSGTGFHWVAVYVMKGQTFNQDAAVRIASA